MPFDILDKPKNFRKKDGRVFCESFSKSLNHSPSLPSLRPTDQPDDSPASGELASQVDELKNKVESSIATMKSLVFSPLSVMFDAVRSEDWLGEDNYLPFTKLNINLGEGMNIDTGRFTAPHSGLYLFILNVYGAPRDAVVLSIR